MTALGWTGGCRHDRAAVPLSPQSVRHLRIGDLIGVPVEPAGWACLQAVDLADSGPGSRTTFIAGVIPWRGDEPPSASSVAGLAAIEQGMTGIEIFTEAGLQVTGNAPVVDSGLPSNIRDMSVGTTHKVWGWRTAIRRAQAAATAR
jgi:hypothetical protein